MKSPMASKLLRLAEDLDINRPRRRTLKTVIASFLIATSAPAFAQVQAPALQPVNDAPEARCQAQPSYQPTGKIGFAAPVVRCQSAQSADQQAANNRQDAKRAAAAQRSNG
jgi:hypothetical protein